MTADDRIIQLMGRVLDGEASDEERSELERHFESAPEDRVYFQQMGQLGNVLRTRVSDELASVDLSGIWGAVEVELDRSPERAAPVQGIQPSLVERVRTWFAETFPAPAPALGWAVAAAAMLAVVVLAPRLQTDVPVASAPVQVEQVDAATDVMIYETGVDDVKVIWVFEGETDDGEQI